MLADIFGKLFKSTFLLIIILELLSFWGQQFSWLNKIVFCLLLMIILVISLIKLEYGLYILLAELFIGSKGYLFFYDFGNFQLSLRISIFIIILSVWLLNLWKKKAGQFFGAKNQFLYFYLVLLLFVIIGLVNGLARHSFNNAFFDFNGWLYFALAPSFFSVIADSRVIRNIFSLMLSAAGYLAIKTLVLLFIFAHHLSLPLEIIYRWVRNTGVGEITFVSANFYRIFFQSQIFIIIALLVVAAFIIFIAKADFKKSTRKGFYWLLLLFGTALLASLSRSFWLGTVAALVLLIICQYKFQPSFLKLVKTLVLATIIIILGIGFLNLLTFNFTGIPLEKRLIDPASEVAGASRLAQLAPLLNAVKQQLLLGSGFGQTVTYQTLDPRIWQTSPDGQYTTFAFEWGYLDIWLKIGLFGLLSYLLLLIKVIIEGRRLFLGNSEVRAIALALVSGLIAIMVTSVFSPYLNHPLGIGYLILVSAIFYYFKNYYAISQSSSGLI